MTDLLFYLLSSFTLLFGALVVVNPFSRNPVTSAMFLALAIISTAGLYVLLHAFFLAAVQILIYAGAIIVLFLFVIMLLDLREEEQKRFRLLGLTGGVLGSLAIATAIIATITAAEPGAGKTPEIEGTTRQLGNQLFADYVLPFEIMGLLLLVAMMGVILLSKKQLR